MSPSCPNTPSCFVSPSPSSHCGFFCPNPLLPPTLSCPTFSCLQNTNRFHKAGFRSHFPPSSHPTPPGRNGLAHSPFLVQLSPPELLTVRRAAGLTVFFRRQDRRIQCLAFSLLLLAQGWGTSFPLGPFGYL